MIVLLGSLRLVLYRFMAFVLGLGSGLGFRVTVRLRLDSRVIGMWLSGPGDLGFKVSLQLKLDRGADIRDGIFRTGTGVWEGQMCCDRQQQQCP